MYNSDKPIEQLSEDKLGRQAFAKHLANSILNFSSTDNFAIGLYGKWGCGKTSIINMALNEIDNKVISFTEDKEPIVVKFNPWNYSDNTQLLTQFFLILSEALKLKNNSKVMISIGEKIEQYSDAIGCIELIPVIGAPFAKLVILAGKQIKNKGVQKSDISKIKSEIVKALKNQKQKIIIVIDDIDRLSNEQIRMIFQLVNSVAGFPNMIYLLSFDKDVVARALSEVQNCNGEEYLEKIIQVPFEVPEVDKSKLNSILFERLDSIINEYPESELNKEYWSNVFRSCISPFITSIRSINRYINAFHLKYSLMYAETNLADLLAITSVQVFAPGIATWIYENKSSLCGGISYQGMTVNEQDKNKNNYLEDFKKVYPSSPEIMIDIVASLFPYFARKVGFVYYHTKNNDLRALQRIAHEDKFDLYFSLSLENILISRVILNDSIDVFDLPSLIHFFENCIQKKNFLDYLIELRANIPRIHKERIELLIIGLFSVIGKTNESKQKESFFFYEITAQEECRYCVELLLKQIDNIEKRDEIVLNLFDLLNLKSFSVFANFVNAQELAHGRLASHGANESEQILSLDGLVSVEQKYVNKINSLVKEKSILDWYPFFMPSYLWKCYDEKGYNNYLNEQLADNTLNQIKLITCNACEWSSSRGIGWSFYPERYEEYISTDKALELIESSRHEKWFWDLPILTRQKLATFVLLNKNGNLHDDFSRISQNMANDLLLEWSNTNI